MYCLELRPSNPWCSFRHLHHMTRCWSSSACSPQHWYYCVCFVLTQETEGWILSLLTAEQQFYTRKPFFNLGTRAWNLMQCKSHPSLPFPPAPLFCNFFLWYIFSIHSILKEILCIFHLQKYYQIYAATHTPYTHTHIPRQRFLLSAEEGVVYGEWSLPFLTHSKLIKKYYTANHD